MNAAVLNNQLSVGIPEGFHVMDADEMRTVLSDDSPNRWGIWDTERHVMVTVLWHESPALFGKLAPTKDLIKRVEKALRVQGKGYAYHCEGMEPTTLCGHDAYRFDYRYEQEGVGQVGQVVLFKHVEGKVCCCYTIYCIAREEQIEQGRQAIGQVLDSMTIA